MMCNFPSIGIGLHMNVVSKLNNAASLRGCMFKKNCIFPCQEALIQRVDAMIIGSGI